MQPKPYPEGGRPALRSTKVVGIWICEYFCDPTESYEYSRRGGLKEMDSGLSSELSQKVLGANIKNSYRARCAAKALCISAVAVFYFSWAQSDIRIDTKNLWAL